MKISLHLQDEQTTLLKAKLPISIFNQPFSSIFTTPTNSISDLAFSLSTAFSSGPSLKLTYIPSTTFPPFSLSLKSGLGFLGSPNNSPLVFSASLSFSGANRDAILPIFSLHFKPQVGHFSLWKKTMSPSSNPNPVDSNYDSSSIIGPKLHHGSPSSSEPVNGIASDGKLGWQELKLEPFCGKEKRKEKEVDSTFKLNGLDGFLPNKQFLWRDGKKCGLLDGFGVNARTVLPLTKTLVVNLRWGVHLPGDLETRLPYLTVDKIGIERVSEEVKEVTKKVNESNVGDVELLKGMCFWMKRDLEVLEKENRHIKQSLKDMRSGVATRNLYEGTNVIIKKMMPAPSDSVGDIEQRRSKKNGDGNSRKELKKPVNQISDLESELQRAIKAAASS